MSDEALPALNGETCEAGACGTWQAGGATPGWAPGAREAARRRPRPIRHRLGDGASAGVAALDALPTPVLVLDPERHVVLANLAAERLAGCCGGGLRLERHGDGPEARMRAGARHRDDTAALASLVRDVAGAGGEGGAVRLRGEGEATALAVLVVPLLRRCGGEGGGRVPGRALLLLREIADLPEPPSAGALRGLFGLSRAEAEVARALAGGTTKAAVAAARGLSETTVRSQVRAVLEKTGATNLRDLERLLAGLRGM
jgi:DNA-binding CsgD family transcriptional regulator